MVSGEQTQEVVLDAVGVLKLVNQDVLPVAGDVEAGGFVGGEELVDEQDEVAEVHGVRFAQALVVERVDVGALDVGVCVGEFAHGIRRFACVFAGVDEAGEGFEAGAVVGPLGLFDAVAQDAEGVVVVVDGEARGEADAVAMLA